MKTTILGVLTIAGGVINAAAQFLKTGSCDFAALGLAVTSGLGLIKAADAK